MASIRKVMFFLAVLVASVSAQADIVSDCPVANGYFADSLQCDKYYVCLDNVLSEKVCPDGMSFNDINHRVEKCDFNYQIDCTSRPELQPAQVTENCPRANGYFAHSEPGKCSEFYYCAGGNGNHLNCPESLVFSLITGTCVWPDQAGRTDTCTGSNVVNFTCPTVPAREAVAHPRYADPDDCQYFYVCINGRTPRRNGCKFGEVFNSEFGACGTPKVVPECKDYYIDYFTDYFANLGTEVPSREILNAAHTAGFQVPSTVTRTIRVRPSATSLSGGNGVRKRGPSTTSAADKSKISSAPVSPVRRRRPAGPVRTPATTTTPPPPPPAGGEDYPADEYDYYSEYVDEGGPPIAAAAEEPAPPASRRSPSLSSRLLPRRPT